MKKRIQYNHLADLFRYPGTEYRSNALHCFNYLEEHYPEAAAKMYPFVEYLNDHSDHEVEEVFGKTFHIQAICYLDIGYVLFAEDYKRGEFLVQMKKEQENAQNDCGEELADNLPNVLSLLPLMEDEEFMEEFAVRILKPALYKMRQEFEESRMKLKDKVRRKKQKVVIMEDVKQKNIYQHAIETLIHVVEKDFGHVQHDDPAIVPTLGGHVGTILSGNCDTSCASPVTTPENFNK